MELNKTYLSDACKTWPADDKSLNTIVTSPPYWGLRDYGIDGQLGLENSAEEFIDKMVNVFREARRCLRDDGTLWLNIGDSYAHNGAAFGNKNSRSSEVDYGAAKRFVKKGSLVKPKDLVGIPWMLAFALRADGWYLRQDIIWSKPNPMPESVNDRCTKSHEYIFLLSKSGKYFFDSDAILEPIAASSYNQNIQQQEGSLRAHPGEKTNGNMKAFQPKGNRKSFRGGGKYTNSKSFDNDSVISNDSIGNVPNESLLRNKRSVWTVATHSFKQAHFATFPPSLIIDCIKAGCPEGGIVGDPFHGAGTTRIVANKLGRKFWGMEIKPEYIHLSDKRAQKELGLFI